MSDAIQEVGARFVALDADAFRTQLLAAADALKTFNTEQANTAKLARSSSSAVGDGQAVIASAFEDSRAAILLQVDAYKLLNDEQARTALLAKSMGRSMSAGTLLGGVTGEDVGAVAASTVGASALMRDSLRVNALASKQSVTEQAALMKTSLRVNKLANTQNLAEQKTAEANRAKVAAGSLRQQKLETAQQSAMMKSAASAAGKIVMWGGLGAAGIAYEGIKGYRTTNQLVSQLAIDAGLSQSQLPAVTQMVLRNSTAYGLTQSDVAQIAYRVQSASPKKLTTAQLAAQVAGASDLTMLAGTTGNADTIGRIYGAISASGLGLSTNKGSISPNQVNAMMLAAAGHGDVYMGQLAGAIGSGVLTGAKAYGFSANDVMAWIDTMSPSMNPKNVATLIQHGMGMLAGPTAQATAWMTAMGGDKLGYTAALKKGGVPAILSYMNQMFHTPLDKSAANFYGGQFLGGGLGGSYTSNGETKYSGLVGFLKNAHYSNAEIAKALAGGIASVPGMQQAVEVAMFGGAKGALPILSLINNPGLFESKYANIATSEKNPSTLRNANKVALSEPQVQWNRFKANLSAIEYTVGTDVNPMLNVFVGLLEEMANVLKPIAPELLGMGAAVLGASGIVWGAAKAEKLVTGVRNIPRALSSIFSGGSGQVTSASLGGLTASADAAAAALDRVALAGVGGSIGGVATSAEGAVAAATGAGEAEAAALSLPKVLSVAGLVGGAGVAAMASYVVSSLIHLDRTNPGKARPINPLTGQPVAIGGIPLTNTGTNRSGVLTALQKRYGIGSPQVLAAIGNTAWLNASIENGQASAWVSAQTRKPSSASNLRRQLGPMGPMFGGIGIGPNGQPIHTGIGGRQITGYGYLGLPEYNGHLMDFHDGKSVASSSFPKVSAKSLSDAFADGNKDLEHAANLHEAAANALKQAGNDISAAIKEMSASVSSIVAGQTPAAVGAKYQTFLSNGVART